MFHRVLELAQGIDPFHIDRERAIGELAGEATVERSDLGGRRFREPSPEPKVREAYAAEDELAGIDQTRVSAQRAVIDPRAAIGHAAG